MCLITENQELTELSEQQNIVIDEQRKKINKLAEALVYLTGDIAALQMGHCKPHHPNIAKNLLKAEQALAKAKE